MMYRVGTNRITKTACSFSYIFPLHRESLVNDIPAGEEKIAYLFYRDAMVDHG